MPPPPIRRTAALPTNSKGLAGKRRRTNQAAEENTSSRPQQNDTVTYNENEPYFGDIPGPKRKGRIRLHCLNINNIGLSAGNPKEKSLYTSIRKYETDILLLQETGVNWSVTPRQHQWNTRLYANFDPAFVKTKTSHNIHDPVGTRKQWGGTAINTHGKLCHYTIGAGSDTSGLGRWTWARYSGKGGVVLRVVSVYNPCCNSSGERSVYAQHRAHFQDQNRDIDPRQAFLEDLDKDVSAWLLMGDQIILGGDLNTSVFSESLQTFFQKHNMHNLIFARHDPTTAPSTYQRNNEDKVIDGLWGTPNIQAERCGYLEAGDFPGDHSALWLDITYSTALGHDPPLPQKPATRRLKLQDPRCVRKYQTFHSLMSDKLNICARQFQLEREIQVGMPLTCLQAKTANNIDRDRTLSMKKAEHKCRKLRMGAVEFSDAIDLPSKQIEFWDIAIKRRKGIRVSQRMYDRHKARAEVAIPIRTLSLDDLFTELKKARQKYNEAKKHDHDSRLSFLESFPKKTRDRLIKNEAQRRLGRASKLVTGKLASKSVVKLEHDGKEYTTKTAIENILLPINEAKMHACEDTPFLQQPLLSEFGYGTNYSKMEEVLAGTYNPPANTDTFTKMLIQQLKLPSPDTPVQNAVISTKEYCSYWKKAKERTAAGLSGLHFGMFKANALDPKLAALDASMCSMAYSTGFSYDRWQVGVDVQILKRSKDFRADKLRTILLLEADFNMNNKKLGRDAMWQGERQFSLTRDNYGGRKGLRPVEVSMNQALTYDSIWAKRGKAVLISNDAKGCFDRIAHTVAFLALRRLGVHQASIKSMLVTIQQMTHHIRTAFGVSETFYGKDPSKPPPQGALQGNGAGPTCWSAVAAPLVNAMKSAGFGYSTWSAIQQRAVEIVCFAFVDDTDIIHASSDPHTCSHALIHQAQHALHTWEGLIRASGGQLAPEKGYWYLIDVINRDGEWIYRPQSEVPGSISLRNKGTPHRIQRLHVDQAKEALGIQIRPDGSMQDQIQYLRTKAEAWSDALRTKRLHPSEAWYCLNSTIMKTIEYPLMATTISRKDMTFIMAPILEAGLRKSKVQSKMPRKLVYGTLRSRGMGIHNPSNTQLIEHLQAIQRHVFRNTPSSDLHLENMELLQCHIGSSTPFWELSYKEYQGLVPEGWMKFTWEELSDSPLSFKGPLATTPHLRIHDVHIMDAFMAKKYDAETLKTLNNCRMFLFATTLSQICTADGKAISPTVWSDHLPIRTQPKGWPNVFNPSPTDWALWNAKLKETFLYPHSHHTRLRRPMGSWKNQDKNLTWWYSPSTNQVYQQVSRNEWYDWHNLDCRSRFPTFSNPLPIMPESLPEDMHHASVLLHHNRHLCLASTCPQYHPVTPNPDSLSDVLENLPVGAKWAVEKCKITDNGHTIAQAIRNKTAVAVSDGSLKNTYGTSAYVIEGKDSTNRITGVNFVPGPLSEGDSLRCELAGLYAIALMITSICAFYNITSGHITVACDNESACRIFDCDFLPDPNQKNFDLIQAIWKTVHDSSISWECKHVKGHQDKHRSTARLTRLERLNVEMDALAKRYWNHLLRHCGTTLPSPPHIQIHNEGWSVWQGQTKLSSPSRETLYAAIEDSHTQMWWVRHSIIPVEAIQDIDWDSNEKFMQCLTPAKRRWVTKQASDNCGVGITLKKWKHQSHDHCPRCGQPENTSHVLRCPEPSSQDLWKTSISDIQKFFDASHTKPIIQEVILTGLRNWRNHNGLHLDHPADPATDDITSSPLYKAQLLIGWKNMTEGFLSIRLRHEQHRFYADEGMQRSSKKWARDLLKALQCLAWKQWDHRNTAKHQTTRPGQANSIRKLDHQIRLEYLRGTQDLPVGDQLHFQHNILSLLHRPLDYKQAWFSNVLSARRRQARRKAQDDTLEIATKETSAILQWMKTGREI